MIQWGPNMEIGVPMIDSQHKELIARANSLVAAMRRGDGRRNIVDVIEFLGQYVEEHFSFEESVMRENNYPKYETHRAVHNCFKADFQALALKFQSSVTKIGPTIEVQHRVMDWLRKHIQGTDIDLGKYLKAMKA